MKLDFKNSGIVLISVTLVMGVIVLLAFYFLDFVITDTKISHSQNLSTQTYYLAEAGLQEALWKIKNDQAWNDSFQNDPNWTANLNRQNPFGLTGSYQVSVQNLDLAEAEVISTGIYQVGQYTAQRVVKIKVFQAMSSTPLIDKAVFSDNEINLIGSDLNVIGGGIFSNDDIVVTFFSDLNVELDVSAVDQIDINWTSNITATEFSAQNYPPPPESLDMPQIDFDSDNENSYLNLADQVYSTAQFNQLMQSGPEIILNGITYVQGNAIIPRGVTLTINGVLVADGNVNIGTDWWPYWENEPVVIVNNNDGPSGILTKKKINVGSYTSIFNVTGLLYAVDEVKLDPSFVDFDLVGGVIARKFRLNCVLNPSQITYDETIVVDTLGDPQTSPVITIEHWEEEY